MGLGAPTGGGSPGGSGWHRDPEGRFEQRFFDGRRWTRRVRVGGAEAIDSQHERPADRVGNWRPDPTGRFEQRFFDGQQWTKRVRVGRAEAIDTQGMPARHRVPSPDATRSGSQERPIGFYADPDGSGQERFFDGYQWTNRYRPAGSQSQTSMFRGHYGRALMVGVAVGVVLLALLIGVVVAVL